MTKQQSLLFRCGLFFAGALVVILALVLSTEGELTRRDAFVWSSIALMYLLFFTPFFFSAIDIKNFSGKIPKLSLVWFGIIMYIIASVAVILLLNVISLSMAVIIQAILLFLFLIVLYLALFASAYIAEQGDISSHLNEIKAKAKQLSLQVGKLPAEYAAAKTLLQKAIDDIAYISPLESANNLEQQLLSNIDTIAAMLERSPNAAINPSELEQKADSLLDKVRERKALRN
ncbi:MAG: hypothetical protein LBV04_05175 [Deferribacteraceae bacterium]|jgi:ABC-type multidrug transport system permease subunit|nr:hypothetical protein [Deferribacteraceae bacterium]